jgi:hypothetical protein
MMARVYISNTLLALGAVLLAIVCLMEVTGGQTDPLLPAFSALFIGGTAVLDRIGIGEFK